MFLLVPAYPGCPGSKAVKQSLLLLLYNWVFMSQLQRILHVVRIAHSADVLDIICNSQAWGYLILCQQCVASGLSNTTFDHSKYWAAHDMVKW